MNKNYNMYFQAHLEELVKDKYSLSDGKLLKLISFLEEFESPKVALKNALREKNKKHITLIVQNLCGCESCDKCNKAKAKKEGKVHKVANTAFSVPVSDQEKESAKKLRAEFERTLKFLEEFNRYLLVFYDHADELEDKEDMSPINSLINRYKERLKLKYNEFVSRIGLSLEHYNEVLSDSEMDNLRDMIVETTQAIRTHLVELLKLFGKVRDPDFIAGTKLVYPKVLKSVDQLSHMIQTELFNHIDRDILGRIRISNKSFPLAKR